MSLEISLPSTQQVTCYQFESTGDLTLEVVKRVMESPYIYSIPSQVLIIINII